MNSDHLAAPVSADTPDQSVQGAGVASPASDQPLRGLAAWKREFYPVAADECAAKDAIAHSLRKWEGLRREALDRHGIRLDHRDLIDDTGARFLIDDTSCALCEWFYSGTPRCKQCPIAISRNDVPCDKMTEGEDRSPWHRWMIGNDPEPMIAALRKAAEGAGASSPASTTPATAHSDSSEAGAATSPLPGANGEKA